MIKRTPEERALRSEYTKQRSIARKRAERLTKKFGQTSNTNQLMSRYGGKLPKLSDLKDDVEIANALRDINKYLAGASTIATYEKERSDRIATFHEYGYDFVNISNYETVIQYLDELHSRKDAELYDSDEIIDIAVQASELKISPAEMENGYIDYEKIREEVMCRLKATPENKQSLSSQEFRQRWM